MNELDSGLLNPQRKNLLFQIMLPAIIVLLLGWYLHICRDYPYYFIWDMDLITTLDSVLIQSGLLPDHIHHTGFGMYLFLFFSEKIAHLFNIVSILDLQDATNSLNPLAAMAELTDFIRFHSPFLLISIVVLLSAALQTMFGLPRRYLLFFIAILGTQESLAYHSSMIRTECYSVFYWSVAILTLTIAVRAKSFLGRYVLLLFTGLLLGLSFLTKLQAMLYVGSFLFLLPLMFSLFQCPREQQCQQITRRYAFIIVVLSFINITVSVIIGIAAHLTVVPTGVETWATSYRITPIAVCLLIAMLLLLFIQLLGYLKNRMSSTAFKYSSFFNIIITGFILSFVLHFFLYSNTAVSLKYLLLDFKMVFVRNTVEVHSLSFYISDFLAYLRYNPMLFIVNIALNLLLIAGYRLKFVRITPSQLIMCLFITAIALGNIFIGTRDILRDTLWKELFLNFLSLLYFTILVTRTVTHRRTFTMIGSALLFVLLFANTVHSSRMPDRIDAHYNHYGWQQNRWFSHVYGNNQRKYSQIMKTKYNATTMRVAEAKACGHREIRNIVDFVFKNQNITLANIGIVFDGFSVWTSDLDCKIVNAPPEMRGAILVDNALIETHINTFFEEKHVRGISEHIDKIKKSASEKSISVLSRNDLKIFLFVSPDDVKNVINEQVVPTNYKITLQNSNQSIELRGMEIRNYSEIPLDKITQKFFFVICKL